MLPNRDRPRGAEGAARALLALACERRPKAVVGLLGRSPREWREFFQGDKKDRVKLWFNHFVHNGMAWFTSGCMTTLTWVA